MTASIVALQETPPVLQRPIFERLFFSQCWEDPRLDAEALGIQPHHVVLTVTSGGDNALSLAALGPSRLICVDANQAQQWMLHLKIAGAKRLAHGEYLELLGVRHSPCRTDLYRECRPALPPEARLFWDRRIAKIERGVLLSGRYECYLGAFRKVLRLIEGRRRIRRLFDLESVEEQRRFYDEEWNRPLWRLFFRIFFSRTMLGLAGMDRSCFTYVDGIGDFGRHFLERARHVLAEIPVRDNYFLAQICLGRFLDERALPPYLLPENFEALKEGIGRVEVLTEELGSLLGRLDAESVDRFNFTNVFEWVSLETFHEMLREIHRVARPGGRLCYRNLLVRRRHPPSLAHLFEPDDEQAARLLREDRSFVYSHFEIATVIKDASREA
jgi:S-adenosylmethionine-diacylglycerol 3-amino-3-carboxypropyl transferase